MHCILPKIAYISPVWCTFWSMSVNNLSQLSCTTHFFTLETCSGYVKIDPDFQGSFDRSWMIDFVLN